MALTLADRIKQYTTSTGTGGLSFTGTPAGFAAFSSVLSSGDTTYYAIEENDKWEVGVGTYGSDNMARSQVLASSNGGNRVNLGGSGIVFITYPADRATYLNENDEFVLGASGLLFSNGTVFKEAKLTELTDVSVSGTVASTHVLSLNNTNKSLLLGDITGPSNSNNTLIGYGAASGITSAQNYVSIGTESAIANNAGIEGVSIGVLSGPSETLYTNPASYVVSVGYKAGSRARSSVTAIGHQAGMAAYETGFVAVGSSAGSGIGSYSVGIGNEAAHGMGSDYVVAVGYQAAKSAAGESAVWIGNMAGISASSSTNSIGIGYRAGKNSSATDSVYIGQSAGQSNSDDDYLYISNGPPSSNRTLIKGDMQSKRLAVGAADVTLEDTFYIGIASSSDKGLVVKSAAGQSDDLTQWQTSAGGSLASVSSLGIVTANQVVASGQGLKFPNSQIPTTPANTLYGLGGTLYWNLSPVTAPTGVETSVAFYNLTKAAIYSDDFTFDKDDKTLTVGNVSLKDNFININDTGKVKIGSYSGDGGITESDYSVILGHYGGASASGASYSFLAGYYSGYSSLNSHHSQIIGSSAGAFASGARNVYVGDSAGIRSSGDYNVFVGDGAGRKCVGSHNIEIIASGDSSVSPLNDYSNKIHIGQTIIGDTDARKLAFGLVSSSNVNPDATVEIFPKTDDLALKVHGSGEFASGIALPSAVPASTTSMLYNDAGTLKFNGSAVGSVSTDQLNYVSGIAVYASGHVHDDIYVSGIATYASGQALSLTHASGLTATNATNITAATNTANYASGQALSLTYASGLTATNAANISTNTSNISTNATNITSTTAVANYASGQALSLTHASGLTATNASNISTNTTNITAATNTANYASGQALSLTHASGLTATNATNITATTSVANYASGQAIENEADIVYISGIAVYASGEAGGGGVTAGELAGVSGIANYASGMQLNGLADVYYGGTNLTRTLLINNNPGSAPTHGTLSNDAADNIAIGYQSLESITGGAGLLGDKNIAIGPSAASGLTTGYYNIAIGDNSFSSENTGHGHIAIGRNALGASADGDVFNTAIGYESMKTGTTSGYNVALGYQSQYVAGGGYNVSLGYQSMYGATGATRSSNTAIGMMSLYSITDGVRNIAIGKKAGYALTSDDDMLFIANDLESSNGTLIKGDMAAKHLAIGKADVTLSTDPATLQVYPNAATDKVLLVQGHATQSDDLTSWQTSAGFVLAAMTPSGVLNTAGMYSSGNVVIGGMPVSNVELEVRGDIHATFGNIRADDFEAGGGSTSNPSYNFMNNGGDSDTGFYNPGANQIGMVVGAAEAVRIDSSANVAVEVFGRAQASGIIVGNSGVVLANNAPTVTTNTLYSVGGSLYFDGSAVGGGGGDVTTAQLVYVSGLAVYGSGQAQSLGYASGVAAYASGQAIENETAIATNVTNIATNTTRVTYASGQAIANEGDIVAVSGIAAYASGHVHNDLYVSGIATYASGQAIENETAIATNVSNISTNTSNISTNSDRVTYASGQAIANETDIVATSGIANYASGQAITNKANIATNTSNISTNITNITSTTAVANYASGEALSLNAASGQAVYASGQAIANEGDIVATSGISAYASGQAITNKANIATNTSNISTNTTNITSTTAVANYASGEAVSLNYASGVAVYASGQVDVATDGTAEASKALILDSAKSFAGVKNGTFDQFDSWLHSSGVSVGNSGVLLANSAPSDTSNALYNVGGTLYFNGSQLASAGGASAIAQYASGQAIANESDIVATSGIAAYASGHVHNDLYVSGIAAYASGQAIANETDIATNVTNIATNSARVTYASGLAITNESEVAYASGQAIANESDIVATSGIAAYASGQAISNKASSATNAGNISTNTSNISTNSTNITATTAVANYASGEAVSLNSASGVAAYASGEVIAIELAGLDGSGLWSGHNRTNTLLLNRPPGESPYYGIGSDCTDNIGIGYHALRNIAHSIDNIALGKSSSQSLTTGDRNVSIGSEALTSDQVGHDNVALGYNALWAVTGSRNIGIGKSAGYAETGSDMLYIAKGTESANGTIIKASMSNKWLAIGKADVNLAWGSTPDPATLQIYPNAATDKVLLIQGYAAQSDDLTSWQTSAGAVVAGMTPSGVLNTYGVVASGAGVRLHQETPTVTTDTLYNVGGSLYFDGSAVGGGTSAEATYASGQAIANESDIVATSGIANYASGQAISNKASIATNTSNISTNTSNISTNVTNITSTTAVANYASGEALSLNAASGQAVYASGQAIANETDIATNVSSIATNATNITANDSDIVAITGVAGYASGQAITNKANIATNTSNISTNTSNISTNTSNISTNATNITSTTAVANYASGEAVSLNSASGVAAYASGQVNVTTDGTAEASKALILDSAKTFTGVKDGNFSQFDSWAKASGVQVGASGVVMKDADLSHTITLKTPDVVSTSFTLPLPSGIGTNGQVLTTDSVQTYWSTVSGGGGISWDGSTANGVATFKDSDEATVESNLTFTGNILTVTTSSSSEGPTVIKGAAGQTADLTSWQNSAGTSVAAMTPSGVLNTGGVVASGAISVTAESNTPLTVQGKSSGNSSFAFKAGTGATSNQAILKLESGNAGNVRIYLGDTDDPDVGQIRYNHSNERFSIRNNAADRFIIGSDGRTGFGTSAVVPTVGYIDVVAHNGTVMCSGVRGHLLDNGTTDGTTAFDINQSTVHAITLDENATFSVTNVRAGDRFMIRVLQDGSGGHSVTWWSTIKWAGNVTPTLSAANKADLLGFLCTGTNTYDGFIVGQGI